LITQKSWWDTVDYLAVNHLGTALQNDKKRQYSYSDQLINSQNVWLRRSAILFQLKYKERTDFDLLQAHILKTISESEFFIRKAAGWALREYSKTNPSAVRQFIQDYQGQLSRLTIREGSKYL
jgi:3-methyladenine DNA glycosylase AlkD